MTAPDLEEKVHQNDSSTSKSTPWTRVARRSGGRSSSEADWQQLLPRSDDSLWKQFIHFMHSEQSSSSSSSYRKYLYRAHTYDYPYRRYDDAHADSFSGKDCISDYRFLAEHEEKLKIGIQLAPEHPPTQEVFYELSRHLRKLRIKRDSGTRGTSYRSRMVSLSGNLCWVTHRVCEVSGIAARERRTTIPGLAVLDVRGIQERGFHVWRVRDMLRFLDQSPLRDSVDIPSEARSWANNADEYVCWDFVPGEAVLSFTPQPSLRPTNGTGKTLLSGNFERTPNLCEFVKLGGNRSVSLDDYVKRVTVFMHTVAPNILGWEVQTPLLLQLVSEFLSPRAWGYDVSVSEKELKRRLNDIAHTDTENSKAGVLITTL